MFLQTKKTLKYGGSILVPLMSSYGNAFGYVELQGTKVSEDNLKRQQMAASMARVVELMLLRLHTAQQIRPQQTEGAPVSFDSEKEFGTHPSPPSQHQRRLRISQLSQAQDPSNPQLLSSEQRPYNSDPLKSKDALQQDETSRQSQGAGQRATGNLNNNQDIAFSESIFNPYHQILTAIKESENE